MIKNIASINKKSLLPLLLILGALVSCTKEEVADNKELVEISLQWVKKPASGSGMKYFLYNLDDRNSLSSYILEDSAGTGFSMKVPEGTYRFMGYNMAADSAKNIKFDASKEYASVVARLLKNTGADMSPIDLYTVCDEIVVKKWLPVKETYTPASVQTKSVRMQIIYPAGARRVDGTLQGVFTSLNLANGNTFEDEGFINFETTDITNPVEIRMIDLHHPDDFLYKDVYRNELLLQLTDLSGNILTGEVNLDNIVKALLEESGEIPNTVYLDVVVSKVSASSKRILLTPAIKIR